jgi:hypothetical protein
MKLIFCLILSVTLLRHEIKAQSQQTYNNLNAICRKFTEPFLKKGYTKAAIDKVKAYLKENDVWLPIYEITYDGQTWTLTPLTRNDEKRERAQPFIDLLNTNIHPDKNVSFLLLAEEPYYQGRKLSRKVNDQLELLFRDCPLLLTCDHPELPWTYKGILIPDFFLLFDKRKEIDKQLCKEQLPWAEKQPKVYFRGQIAGFRMPYNHENGPKNPRIIAAEMALTHSDFIDVGITDISQIEAEDEGFAEPSYVAAFKTRYQSLFMAKADFDTHGQYRYLLSTDGFGAAWGRVPLILSTGSIAFIQKECNQFFYGLLKDRENCIMLKNDLSDIPQHYRELENNPDFAKKIAAQGRMLAQTYFTMESLTMYLRMVIGDITDSYKI